VKDEERNGVGGGLRKNRGVKRVGEVREKGEGVGGRVGGVEKDRVIKRGGGG